MIDLIRNLNKQGVCFDKGLTKREIVELEELYGIKFPPDLIALYSIAVPILNGFINWRDFSENNVIYIKEKICRPQEDIICEICNGEFWCDSWGDGLTEKTSMLKNIKESPKLIPIYAHRYIPMKPFEENNPVFSVYHTDIIYYGENLKDYFQREFFGKKDYIKYADIKKIEFWSDFVEEN